MALNDIAPTSELVEKAMDAAGITSYNTPEAAARAMATLVKYAEIKKRFAKAEKDVSEKTIKDVSER